MLKNKATFKFRINQTIMVQETLFLGDLAENIAVYWGHVTNFGHLNKR